MKFPLIRRAKRGAALAEYAVLVGLIAVASIFSIDRLGQQVADTYDDIAVELSELPGDTPTSPVGDPDPDSDPSPTDTPTTGPTTGPTTPPADCVVVPDDGNFHTSRDTPGSPCFTHDSDGSGTLFVYEDINGPIWVSGGNSESFAFFIDSSVERYELVVADDTARVEAANMGNFVDVRFPTISSQDVAMNVETNPGMFGGPDMSNLVITGTASNMVVTLLDCPIGTLSFTDRSFDHAAVEAETGQTCTKPDPVDNGGGGDFYDKYSVMDGCLTSYNYETNESVNEWCPGPNGGAGLPADLIWAPIPAGYEYGNSNGCAYDPAPEWDGYVTMMGVYSSPDPEHHSLACY